MGDRFASHPLTDLDHRDPVGPGDGPDGEHDWIEALAALDECDGYVVLMVDPQTSEVDAHGPYGGPEAAVAADALRSSLTAEGLDDVAVRIVRLHLPARAA
ncbi:hypothetical protein [Actinomycetospora termitidis]|uniref:Uncharacterized protein n=1 Tax=Actinomycetospora termitidis TaxID=3053470 RepID=A0ABT7M5J7_9PSEU|nr:hypothetical protein [Actinomycetospora sp. Odt1-22]MDL5155726.1 hypothetical protein [Actinomycetospora sp. Odt1-22]